MNYNLIVSSLLLAGLSASGCHSRSYASAQPLRSEREYAQRSEDIAQSLYKSGQATSIEDARAQALSQTNVEWAETAKAQQKQRSQEKFEKDLSKSLEK